MRKAIIIFWILIQVFSFKLIGQVCFPENVDKSTGSVSSSTFTQPSKIESYAEGMMGENGQAGYARFDISEIPTGAFIQNIELRMFIESTTWRYWRVMPLQIDPLSENAYNLYYEITDASYFYAATNPPDIFVSDWWIKELSYLAVADLQNTVDSLADWFGIGVWEYMGGDYSLLMVSMHGWDEEFSPYLYVSYKFPLTPGTVINPNPGDFDMHLDLSPILTWDFGDSTKTYDLYYDTNFPPTNKVVSDDSSGITGYYSPGELEYQTTYYWQVVAKNNFSDETREGPIWTFSTICEPTDIPYFEGFEEVIVPKTGYCNTVENANEDGATWYTTESYYPYEGDNCIMLKGDFSWDDWFYIAPLNLLGGVNYKVEVYYQAGYSFSTGGNFVIKYGDQPNSLNMIEEPILFKYTNQGGEYLLASGIFAPEENGTYYVGFWREHLYYSQIFFMDNISIDYAYSFAPNIYATPEQICLGQEEVQLDVEFIIGEGEFLYYWYSNPEGFESYEKNPIVSPTESTTYYCVINNGVDYVTDSVFVPVYEIPFVAYVPAIDYYCLNWESMLLEGGYPDGGTYSGPGVYENFFYPGEAGIGTHTITYTYENEYGCADSISAEIEVDLCTGIEEFPQEVQIKVLPNPNNGLFTIEFDRRIRTGLEVIILNSSGDEVYKKQDLNSYDGRVLYIDLSDQPTGLYFMHISTQDFNILKKVIIK